MVIRLNCTNLQIDLKKVHKFVDKVWFIPQYTSKGDQSDWENDVTNKRKLINAGDNFYNGESTHDYNKPWWRLCLDAYGSVNGVYAYGWMW